MGTIAESWDTVVGPAIAAAAVIAFETWQQVNDAEVPIKLQDSLDDANAGHDLAYYAGDSDGRALMIQTLVRSTMPDYLADRLSDPTYGTAPAAGPASASDPIFISAGALNPAGSLAGSFLTQDWDHQAIPSTSVRNGWFVQTRAAGRSATPRTSTTSPEAGRRAAPRRAARPRPASSSTGGPGSTARTSWPNASAWRTVSRRSMKASTRAADPEGFLLPSGNVDLGEVCVYPNGTSFPFPVSTGDRSRDRRPGPGGGRRPIEQRRRRHLLRGDRAVRGSRSRPER